MTEPSLFAHTVTNMNNSADFQMFLDNRFNYIHDNNETEEDFNSRDKDKDINLSLAEELLYFLILTNIPVRAMQQLLNILNYHNVPNVPKTMHMLRMHEKTVPMDIMNLTNGNFAYLGIKNNLEFLMDNAFFTL